MSQVLSSLERVISPRNHRLRQIIKDLTDRARIFGLSEQDAANAEEALAQNEFGQSLDLIIAQLYEFSISVDEEFVGKTRLACEMMKIDWNEYAFIEDSIRK